MVGDATPVVHDDGARMFAKVPLTALAKVRELGALNDGFSAGYCLKFPTIATATAGRSAHKLWDLDGDGVFSHGIPLRTSRV
jgi:hypothetical protein